MTTNGNGDSLHVPFDTRRTVISESIFPHKSSLDTILEFLRGQRVTGKLVVNISQGGVNTVTFEEKNSVPRNSTQIEVR